jgi:hypothetical protein
MPEWGLQESSIFVPAEDTRGLWRYKRQPTLRRYRSPNPSPSAELVLIDQGGCVQPFVRNPSLLKKRV